MFLKKSYQNNPLDRLTNTANFVSHIKRKGLEFVEFIRENKHAGVVGTVVAFYKEYTLGVLVGGLAMVFVALSVIVLSVEPERQNVFVEASDSDSAVSLDQLKHVNTRYNLETTAHAVIYNKNWKKQNIVDFSSHWNNLTRQEKREIKQTVWFQLLENALIQKLKSSQVKVGNKGNKLLLALSEKLNIQVPANQDATVYKTGLASATENKRNKKQQKKTVVKAKTVALTATDIEPLIKQQTEKQDSAAPPATKQVEVMPQPVGQAAVQSQEVQGVVNADKPEEQNENVTQDLQVAQLEETEQPIDQDPFAPDMMTETKPLNNIELSSTAKKGRVIRFDNAQLAAQENSQPQQDKQPQIVASARNVPLASEAEPRSPASALDEMTSLFASSYETGNIKVFTSLFASDAVSNDAPNLAAIKTEYDSLFKTTSERFMKINNMKWNFNNDTAIGDGELQVSVKANDSDQQQTFSGIIHFEVRKQGDDWQITKLYHAIN